MATINGKQSVFITPPAPKQETDNTPPPSPKTVDMQTHVENQIDDAIEFARDLQAWLDDEQAQDEYQAWSQTCRDAEPLPEQTDAEKRAEAYELAKLGENALHCIAGHDIKWQQGGS